MKKFLIAIGLCLHAVSMPAQQLDAPLDHGQRIELLKKFLEPQRQALIAEPNSELAGTFPCEIWMEVDPEWTMDFMMERSSENEHQDVPSGHRAMLVLSANPTSVKPAKLLSILKNAKRRWMYLYVERVVANLPDENSELKKQVVDVAAQCLRAEPFIFSDSSRQLWLANQTNDEKWIQEVSANLQNFYESGEAAKALAEMEKNKQIPDHAKVRARFSLWQHAPEEFKQDFQVDPDENNMRLQTFLFSKMFTQEEKLEKLKQVEQYHFRKQPFHHMIAAGRLGAVAEIDSETALRWSEETPTELARIWARLRIAPAMAKLDQGRARKLIRDSFQRLKELSNAENGSQNYGYPPVFLATAGLQLAAGVDPEIIGPCLEIAHELLDAYQEESGQTPKLFFYIAQLAEFDRERARELFDVSSRSVSLSNAAGFFQAMVAIYPEQVWDEYQTLPEPAEGQIDYRSRVRTKILNSLAKKSNSEFWKQLVHQDAIEKNDSWIEIGF